jgi:membrane protease YdiL (CAAX protease family)
MNSTMQRMATANWFPWDYMIATFGFSWLCWLPGVLETRGVLDLPIAWEVFLLLGICGPLVGAIWTNVRRGGWTAARGLLVRVCDVRIGAVWWLVSVVAPPVLSAVALLSRNALQGKAVELGILTRSWMILPTILFMMLLGGGQEEFGWRGYALDILQGQWGALVASVVLGLIWGVWHLPLFFVEHTGQYYTPMWAFMLASPALSILATWVYNGTGKRLFAAWLFHGAVNAGMDVFPPTQKVAGGNQGAFLILCGAYWVWALAVVVFGRHHLVRGTGRTTSAPRFRSAERSCTPSLLNHTLGSARGQLGNRPFYRNGRGKRIKDRRIQ